VKVSVNGDGTVLFFTPKGRMLVDAPKRPEAPRRPARREMAARSTEHGDGLALSNGAALYRDFDIPWEIEAAAREAMEESFER
jgi:8-oxo-dGTP pyrophosphatase MutT (NUDIX family)